MKKVHNKPARKEPKDRKNNPQRKQISVTLPADVRVRFRTACEIQEHAEGQLGRILIEWALPFYERTRSVEALKYLATKHFTSLPDQPMEQREPELDLSLDYMVAGGGR